MFNKLAFHALNAVAYVCLFALVIVAAPFIFCAWLLTYYRKLELRFVYNGDEAAQDRDKYYNR